ncbi:replication restart helicase PriA [Pajaroellobacter abortibovis]|nr:primosomal protein N' [Pajaroellobacter abortibovis]
MRIAHVALPLPVSRLFSYEVVPELDNVQVGSCVLCSFRQRRMVGIVLACEDREPPQGVTIKPLLSVLQSPASIPLDLVTFLQELASYYMAPIGEVMRFALPGGLVSLRERDGNWKLKGGRAVQWVMPTLQVEVKADLRGQAVAILAHLRACGAAPLSHLVARWKNTRAVVKKLVSLGLVRLEAREAEKTPLSQSFSREPPPILTPSQEAAMSSIRERIRNREKHTFLLQGVTGSGKTEVYLRAIAEARQAGRGVIVLVPEIALTPQLIARFQGRFGEEVAVLHSGLTGKERYRMWHKLHQGEADVVIGARSALFAPVRRVGLIIVDEEHDPSFKQEEGVRYHARDMAMLRCHRAGGVCILGTATPSVETEYLVRKGKISRLLLPDRAGFQPMPQVSVVDLRKMKAGPGGNKFLSLPLHRALEQTLEAQEQAILFLNRRGFAPSVLCTNCGYLMVCPLCSVALTLHKKGGELLRCHYCDHQKPMKQVCTACGQSTLSLEGLGTERLEETLHRSFPQARIGRLDRDVGSNRNLERVLNSMRERTLDILVGTQMVAKGHDLPHVTLVGIIHADAVLAIPDFRTAERAFQLFVQVAGRAGRRGMSGRVLLQTHNPSHFAVVRAVQYDVDGFLEKELADRQELAYPPITRAALIRIDAVKEEEAKASALQLARVALAAAQRGGGVTVLGPAPAPIARVRNRFRFRVMVRSLRRDLLRDVLKAVEAERQHLSKRIRVSLDIDPVQLL